MPQDSLYYPHTVAFLEELRCRKMANGMKAKSLGEMLTVKILAYKELGLVNIREIGPEKPRSLNSILFSPQTSFWMSALMLYHGNSD